MGILVSDATADTTSKKDSTDLLLWLGALVIAGVGVSWLVMTQPWSSQPAAVGGAATTPQHISTASLPAVERLPEPKSAAENSIRVARWLSWIFGCINLAMPPSP